VNGCTEFNDAVKAEIRRLKPNVVVVDSFWANPQYEWHGALDTKTIHDALMSLRNDGETKLVAVGTVPIWQFPEPTIVAREWRKDDGVIPEYSLSGLNPSTFIAEKDVRNAAEGTGADYLPLLDKLCTAKGCLLMADRQRLAPLQLDGWHLTTAGSVVVAHLILPAILAQ
jgi:hypothetical protein